MTTKQNLFETKEQYLAFRKAWAATVNDPQAKPTLEIQQVNDRGSHYEQKHKRPGYMLPAHQLLFNILCGYKPYRGFTPITKHTKLKNQGYFNYGYFEAVTRLKSLIATFDTTPVKPYGALKALIDHYEEFSNGEDLAGILKHIKVPAVSLVDTTWGKGKKGVHRRG